MRRWARVERLLYLTACVCLALSLVPIGLRVDGEGRASAQTGASKGNEAPGKTTRIGDEETAQRAKRSKNKRRRRRQRRKRPRLSRAYRKMRAGWHERAPKAARRAWLALDPRPLVLRPVARPAEEYALVPFTSEGGFSGAELDAAREALAYRRDASSTDIHPRLLELLYRAVLRFRAPYVHVISGYRPTRQTSRHAQGRAVDFVLPGVSDSRLAAFMRQQGFVGVGIYPMSGFVHVDVRDRSYFWVDRSLPGRAQRTRAILADETRRVDRAARRRGEETVTDLAIPDAPIDEEGISEVADVDSADVDSADSAESATEDLGADG